MNNILKGTIAAGAGIVLLLGGAGTFALWNASSTTAGGTIVAGDLSITPVADAPFWTVNGGSPLSDLDGYPIVPGDVVTYSTDMTITATGDNLVATLDIDPASISPTSTTAPADVALADYLTASAVLDATGDGISAGPAPYTVTAGTDGVSQLVSVDVTITFPKSTTPGFENDTKLGSVDLDELAVTLTQN